MVDRERVRRRVKAIDEALADLRPILSAGRGAFLGDRIMRAAAERLLQIGIQAALDIALHISAEDSPREPDDYASAFVLMADLGIVGRDLSLRLANAAKMRNVSSRRGSSIGSVYNN